MVNAFYFFLEFLVATYHLVDGFKGVVKIGFSDSILLGDVIGGKGVDHRHESVENFGVGGF